MVELERNQELLRDFGLTTAAELLDARLEEASNHEMAYFTFLSCLLEAEEQSRKRCREETRLKLFRLPHRKTLEKFDFTVQPSIDTRLMNELATLAFVARKESVIFLGPPGVGKTHLAVGLAMKAIRAGMTVYYASLSKLIADLKKADEQNRPGAPLWCLHTS